MDTGYPALIAEPLTNPNEPISAKLQCTLASEESQALQANLETKATETPILPI